MSHYIISGGAFEQAYDELMASGWSLDSKSTVKEMAESRVAPTSGGDEGSTTTQGKRQKYVCPDCELAAWAKFGASLKCGDCDEDMTAA